MGERVEGESDVLSVDAAARRLLSDLVGSPGVHRAALALAEGGGRRLRLTSVNANVSGGADNPDREVTWGHIDAYDDVPLTFVVRTGERVDGLLANVRPLFPDYIDHLEQFGTAALYAVPIRAGQRILGATLVMCESAESFAPALRARVDEIAAAASDELRQAQFGAPRDSTDHLADESIAAGAVAHDLVIAGDPRAVASARGFLRDTLADAGIGGDVIDTGVLCLSEIVTNAVIHTRADCELRIVVEAGLVTVTVRDRGNIAGSRPDLRTDQDPLRVHGRGLQLVDALAARWGSQLDTMGTTVWFVLET